MENGIRHIRGTGRERMNNFIMEFNKKNGYAPSIREICVGTEDYVRGAEKRITLITASIAISTSRGRE